MVGRRKHGLDQNRIAMMIPTLAGGGAERTYLILAKGFQKSGYQVDLIVARATGEYLSQIPPGIELVDLKASRMAKTLPGLVRYLQTRRPRVLMPGLELTHMIALMAQMASGVPSKVIVTIHSVISQNDHFYLPTRSLEKQLMKLLYPQAGEIIAVSKGVAEDFSSFLGFPLSSLRVIYNPIITAGMLEKAQQPFQHAWLDEGQPPVILSVGRLHPVKDIPMLIKAFALARQHTPLRLMILGEGKQREELESLVRQMGLQEDISMPGFQQNPYAFLRRAAMLVLSSRHEAFGRVLIEAMACGCTVISTDCPGGVAELVDNGKYGHLVPVGDAEAMAQAILDVLGGDVRKPPSEWLHQFELDQVIQSYLKLI